MQFWNENIQKNLYRPQLCRHRVFQDPDPEKLQCDNERYSNHSKISLLEQEMFLGLMLVHLNLRQPIER